MEKFNPNDSNATFSGTLVSNSLEVASTIDESISTHPTNGFFVVGLVINLAVLAAFFYWAYHQWKKTGKFRDSSESQKRHL